MISLSIVKKNRASYSLLGSLIDRELLDTASSGNNARCSKESKKMDGSDGVGTHGHVLTRRSLKCTGQPAEGNNNAA